MILVGDNIQSLQGLPDNSIDSIVTDPPYGLAFMGKSWDYDVPGVKLWGQCFRVLKPGGYLLAFAGTRTQHRMAVNIEDAGFEIRDMIAWVYGSGFPKSHNISKAIDKKKGCKPEVVGKHPAPRAALDGTQSMGGGCPAAPDLTRPASDEAKQWDGWGTALKPALEPITVARKPFKDTVAANVLEHGTGGINVDGCRVGTSDDMNPRDFDDTRRTAPNFGAVYTTNGKAQHLLNRVGVVPSGRWPANLIHDGSEEVVGLFPQTKESRRRVVSNSGSIWGSGGESHDVLGHHDSGGSAARFFYCAKASKSERNAGLDAFDTVHHSEITGRKPGNAGTDNPRAGARSPRKNIHPTVKPIDLMRYLVRLVTPPGGTVLDPFLGSGTTGIAAGLEDFNFIGMELSEEYAAIAEARIEHWVSTELVQPVTHVARDSTPAQASLLDWIEQVDEAKVTESCQD